MKDRTLEHGRCVSNVKPLDGKLDQHNRLNVDVAKRMGKIGVEPAGWPRAGAGPDASCRSGPDGGRGSAR